jgi:TldD protein
VKRSAVAILLALSGATAFLEAQKPEDDPILKAMREEMARARTIKLQGVPDQLYFIEYGLDDVHSFSATGTLGALVRMDENHARVPRVLVRVGAPSFDNTNYLYTDLFGSARAGGGVPLDNDVTGLRHYFWLATDRVFKGSIEAIARKRAALRNVTQQEKLNDFAAAQPTKTYQDPLQPKIRKEPWQKLVRELSAVLAAYPKLTNSQVEFEADFGNSYYVNSEGSEARYPDGLFFVRARAGAQAPDGMMVRDAAMIVGRSLDKIPAEADLRKAIGELGRNVTAMLDAPVSDDYSGPMLFEGAASPQLFAQMVGANLGLTRQPVLEPGRPFPAPQSEFEGRKGSRVLPEWMDVVDDPVREEWRGQDLLGSYPVDMEGVVPQPLKVVTAGTLENFLMTRLPVRGFEGSNGRARLPGPFGSKAAVFSNLFVTAKQTVPDADLRKKLLEMVAQRGKPYGIVVRKLDLPASGSLDELQRQSMSSGQRGGSTRPVALPLMIYRLYPDGREELVRGVRFRGLNARSLRDIVAASATETAFHFAGNGSPLPVMNAGGYVSLHSVVAPSVLFEDLELEKRQEDWPKLPVVPAPALVSAK